MKNETRSQPATIRMGGTLLIDSSDMDLARAVRDGNAVLIAEDLSAEGVRRLAWRLIEFLQKEEDAGADFSGSVPTGNEWRHDGCSSRPGDAQ